MTSCQYSGMPHQIYPNLLRDAGSPHLSCTWFDGKYRGKARVTTWTHAHILRSKFIQLARCGGWRLGSCCQYRFVGGHDARISFLCRTCGARVSYSIYCPNRACLRASGFPFFFHRLNMAFYVACCSKTTWCERASKKFSGRLPSANLKRGTTCAGASFPPS